MGFFGNFVSKAVSIIKGIVVHPPPYLKTIIDCAGVVAQGIPGLGLALDVAAPAMDAIFSTDNPSDRTKGDSPHFKLQQDKQDVDAILVGVKTYITESEASIKTKLADISRDLQLSIQQVTTDLKQYHEEEKYYSFLGEVDNIVDYFATKEDRLRELTASSGPAAFDMILDEGKSECLPKKRDELKNKVGEIKTKLTQLNKEPSQQMLDLYLLAIHWLLIFDKVTFNSSKYSICLIVTRGLQARAYWAAEQYREYLKVLLDIDDSIKAIQHDAQEARKLLIKIVNRLEEDEHRESFITTNLSGDVLEISDSWNPNYVGWVSKTKVEKALNVTLTLDMTGKSEEFKTLTRTQYTDVVLPTYTSVVRRNLEATLALPKAVIESLEESIYQWNNRLPLTATLAKQNSRWIEVKGGRQAERKKDAAGKFIKSRFWNSKVSYAVTFVNQYGESHESKWSAYYKVEPNVGLFEIALGGAKFENDPTEDIPLIATGEEGPNQKLMKRDRGIRRRIYVKYNDSDGVLRQELAGDVGESDEFFIHSLMDSDKLSTGGEQVPILSGNVVPVLTV